MRISLSTPAPARREAALWRRAWKVLSLDRRRPSWVATSIPARFTSPAKARESELVARLARPGVTGPVRSSAGVAASFSAKYENPTLADIGFVQQLELYEQLAAQGASPVVIDSSDIRRDPGTMLRALCGALGLPWDAAMLSWPAGGHPSDGVWAAHWYASVHGSTGFAPAEGDLPHLDGARAKLARAAMPAYEALGAARLRP